MAQSAKVTTITK